MWNFFSNNNYIISVITSSGLLKVDLPHYSYFALWMNGPHCWIQEHNKLIAWIQDFLCNRIQSICVNGEFSTWFDVLSGIPVLTPYFKSWNFLLPREWQAQLTLTVCKLIVIIRRTSGVFYIGFCESYSLLASQLMLSKHAI